MAWADSKDKREGACTSSPHWPGSGGGDLRHMAAAHSNAAVVAHTLSLAWVACTLHTAAAVVEVEVEQQDSPFATLLTHVAGLESQWVEASLPRFVQNSLGSEYWEWQPTDGRAGNRPWVSRGPLEVPRRTPQELAVAVVEWTDCMRHIGT